MLFRIEDVQGYQPNLRTYDPSEFVAPIIDKSEVDSFIAQEIRKQLNVHKTRGMWSYSKSLAACLLKYNKFTDNELHIFFNADIDYIAYVSHKGNVMRRYYALDDRLDGAPLFNKAGKIRLIGFVVDVSDNALADEYLRQFTGVGLKKVASPEKDSEVIVMNPPNDTVISCYIDSVYLLYALQYKYNFLNDADIREDLIAELEALDDLRFDGCHDERFALIRLIEYLALNWQEECSISGGIYKYSREEFHPSAFYDSILQFNGILKDDFETSLYLGDYNGNVVSELLWKYCGTLLDK